MGQGCSGCRHECRQPPGNCWSLVVARGLTVWQRRGAIERPSLCLQPNTSIHLLQVATGAVYFLGYFRDTIIHWSTLPLPSSLRSICVYGRVGLSPDRGSFRGDQIGTYRDAGGGSTEPTGRYIATRPILQFGVHALSPLPRRLHIP